VDERNLLIEKVVREMRRLKERDHELGSLAIRNDSGGYRPTRLRVDKIMVESARTHV
jgi:hypothetical protein